MKYISIDIETTGLNPVENDTLEIGAYIEDSNNPLPREQLPCFHVYIWKENYRGNAFALEMNHQILKKILKLKKANDSSLVSSEEVANRFGKFLLDNKSQWPNEKIFNFGPFVVAGKNLAGFDLPFLNQLPGWNQFKFHRRVVDPGILYFDPTQDEVLPDTSLCKKRAGLSEFVAHEALDDAWDVISLIRHKFPSK